MHFSNLLPIGLGFANVHSHGPWHDNHVECTRSTITWHESLHVCATWLDMAWHSIECAKRRHHAIHMKIGMIAHPKECTWSYISILNVQMGMSLAWNWICKWTWPSIIFEYTNGYDFLHAFVYANGHNMATHGFTWHLSTQMGMTWHAIAYANWTQTWHSTDWMCKWTWPDIKWAWLGMKWTRIDIIYLFNAHSYMWHQANNH